MIKKDSTHFYITTSNATTKLPIVNNAPDFSGITEPTVSILQQVWESNSVEIIPDPEPIVIIQEPDWSGLAARVLGGDLYPLFTRLTIEASGLARNDINLARNDINLAVTVIRIEAALASGLSLLQQFGFVFTEEEKQLWNNAAEELSFSDLVKIL
jgi:hypothetical protein